MVKPYLWSCWRFELAVLVNRRQVQRAQLTPCLTGTQTWPTTSWNLELSLEQWWWPALCSLLAPALCTHLGWYGEPLP